MMKLISYPVLALICLSGRALAENCAATALAAVPKCAQGCILNGAPSIGCGGTDFSCQCQQSAALYAALEDCVEASCPAASYQDVIDGVSTVCDCAAPDERVAGSASVSGISGTVTGTVTGVVTGTVTGTVPASVITGTATGSGATGISRASSSGTVTTSAPAVATTSGGGQGNGGTWTGYSSVSNVATASVIGAAAQATPPSNVMHYLVPVAMVGVAML